MREKKIMKTIFRNGQIFDGRGRFFSGYIVVEGERIAKVGRGSGPSGSKGTAETDLQGHTLLPGIIDCHVHLFLDGSPDPTQTLAHEADAILILKSAANALHTLLSGITTVRDLGARNQGNIHLRNAINLGIVPGPRILACGEPVCMTGGHGWPMGREADGEYEVRKAVREQLKAGADVVKLMATGGVMTPGVQAGAVQLGYEELRAGVEEAHNAGRLTASHVQGKQGLKNALKAGVDSIEHGIFLDDETIEILVLQKIFLVPTLSAPHNIIKNGIAKGIPAWAIEKTEQVADAHMASARKALQGGVNMAMGTDAGTPFNLHGDNLQELELLVEIGMSPGQALTAATRTAAQVLGLEKEIGTIEEGKLADVIVVDGNPLNDIKVLQKNNIVAIMKGGKFHKSMPT
jgi:imidazolonepropionase-like amidohydrolase